MAEYECLRWTLPSLGATLPLRRCLSREVAPVKRRRRNGENVHFEETQGFSVTLPFSARDNPKQCGSPSRASPAASARQ